ncbi:AroM family protein [Clostridiaceae bacterium 35-E11]
MDRKFKIGAITIGQSPRVDIMEDVQQLLGGEFEIIERGALDNFNYETVQSTFYPSKGDTVLVSRMRDGKQVKLGEEKIIPLLQENIYYLEKQGCQIILMMCTGKFPKFQHEALLILPQELLHMIAQKLSGSERIGVIVPDRDQIEAIRERWNQYGVEVEMAVASPYQKGDHMIKAAENFRNKDVELIFMDCMGYSVKTKREVRRISGKPVLLPRTLAARVIQELLD